MQVNLQGYQANNNPRQISPGMEANAKANLIKILLKELVPKIKNEIGINYNTSCELEKCKQTINKKLDKFDLLDKKKNELTSTISKLQNDLVNYNFKLPETFDLSNLSNLDSILHIPYKEYYQYYSKQKTMEEYLVFIRKAVERNVIDYKTAANLIRKHSKQMFYFNYKSNKYSKNIFNTTLY
jgi:hypothetical protein